MEKEKHHLGYRFAILFSLFLHLLFVTTVDGALFFGKMLSPQQIPVILKIQTKNIQTVDARSKKKSSMTASKPNPKEIPKPDSNLKRETFADHFQNVQSLKQSYKEFKKAQNQLDGRIQNIKNNLHSTERRDGASIETLRSQVSDVGKVPIQLRKNVLPPYLKKMRFEIANRWSQIVEANDLNFGKATIEYQIAPNGTISKLKLRDVKGQTSVFSASCFKAVREASPFDPLPFRFETSDSNPFLTISLTFYLRKKK